MGPDQPPPAPAPLPGAKPPTNGRPPWFLLVVSIAAIVIDIALPSAVTGGFATLAMSGIAVMLMRTTVGPRRTDGPRPRVASADIIVLLALLSLLVARGYVVVQQITDHGMAFGVLSTATRTYDVTFAVLSGLGALSVAMPRRLALAALRLAQRPAVLLATSFAALIVVSTLLLTLPVSVRHVSNVSFIESLFTATSAVCVTGLTVNDVPANYTFFGQLVILLSIQLGGIGIMTLAALALAFARNSSLATQLQYAAMLDVRTLADLRTMVRSIVFGTLAVEAVGALALWALLVDDPRAADQSSVWLAVFHSVSAFCNAGFALFAGSITPFADSFAVQAVIMVLIVLGGIGFPVMRELLIQARVRLVRLVRRDRPVPTRISLATRVVLSTTAALIVLGTVLLGALEYGGPAMESLSGTDRVMAALFASVNTRTSGFNTIDFGAVTDASLLVMCVLMFIGGSPGSTAGGIKTTTFATILATLPAEMLGREPRLGRRAIAPAVFRRATAVTVISAAIVLFVLFVLTLTEDQPFVKLLFETISAFATVGLSTGITGDLTVAGKLIIVFAMFIGRVGPLTVALAVATSPSKASYRLAQENLPIG